MKKVKKIGIVFLLVHLVVLTLVGCMQSHNTIAIIKDEQISEPVYRIFLWQAQQGLESLYPDIWKMESIGGKPTEEFVKEKALSSISYHIVAKEKAQELGIKLIKEEKQEVKKTAETAFDNNEAINEAYHIKKKDYESFYTSIKLSEKVLKMMSNSYQPNQQELEEQIASMKEEGELPQDEAVVECLLVSTKNELGEDIPEDKKQDAYVKAKELLNQALQGRPLSELNTLEFDNLSIATSGEYIFQKDKLEPELQTIIFEKAIVGEVYPEVVETNQGYKIIKVLQIKHTDEKEVYQKATEAIGDRYAKNELQEMSKLASIETTEEYEAMHLMVAENGH